MQERPGREIVEALSEILQAHGVAVYLDAVHLCIQMRGVSEVESRTRTTSWQGVYSTEPELRAGFLRICDLAGS